MKRITCCECGKLYHYEQDEFCPRCGAYNPPDGRRGFSDHAHLNGAKASVPSSRQLQKDDPVSTASKNFLYSREFQQAARPAAYASHYRAHPKQLVVLVVVVAALLLAFLAFNLANSMGGSAETETVTHELGSAFQVAGKQITLSNPRWVDVADFFLDTKFYNSNGEEFNPSFLAVDVRITTTDPDLNDFAPTFVYFSAAYGDGGTSQWWSYDTALCTLLLEEADLELVDMSQALVTNDTLSGQLLFQLEEHNKTSDAHFTIEEYAAGFAANRYLKAEHIIPLDLDGLPYAVSPAQA